MDSLELYRKLLRLTAPELISYLPNVLAYFRYRTPMKLPRA